MQFNDLTGEVRAHGINYRFRPKTFELLRLLASDPAQVFSKTAILQQIWPDAIVEEQAIFQSINEIRKAFAPVEVIKNYPKKGYTWILPTSPTSPIKPDRTQTFFSKRLLLLILAVLLLSILIVNDGRNSWISLKATLHGESFTGANTTSAHRAILVLPFNVSKLDSSQHWLKFAGMDALIQQLQPNSNLTVFQMADVIDILKRLAPLASTAGAATPTSLNTSESDIARLFQIAGVTHIVQVEITGVPGDYQLIYVVHQAKSAQKSLLHLTSFEQDIPQLALNVSAKLEKGSMAEVNSAPTIPRHLTINSDFQSHLLANALELVAAQQFSQALPLATSAVTLDPTNILAHYVLVGIQLQLGNFVEAFTTVEHALTLQNEASYSQYMARLWYQKGVLLLLRRDFLMAEAALQQAATFANQQQDWLYLAYSHSMLAQLKLAQQQYEQALPLLNAALQYQQMLHCPLGIAQSELDLAAYYMLTGQAEQAVLRYQASSELVQQRGLFQLQPSLLEFKTRWQKRLSE